MGEEPCQGRIRDKNLTVQLYVSDCFLNFLKNFSQLKSIFLIVPWSEIQKYLV